MTDVSAVLKTTLLIAVVFLVSPLLMAFVCGASAMLAGLLFETTIRDVWRAIGVNLDRFSMFEIGVALGFAGSFVKACHISRGGKA